MSVKKQIIKGTIILTGATILSRVLGFLYRIFLSNLIGAKGMGIFQLIFPVLGFCIAISCGGIQIAVSRFVAESKNLKERFLVLLGSIIMSLALSVLTMGLLYVFADSISIYLIHNKHCTELLKLAAFTIPLAAIHSCIGGYYLGMKKTFVPAVSAIIEQIVKVVSIVIIGLVCTDSNIKITPIIAVYSMIISEIFGAGFCLISVSGESKYAVKFSHLFASIKKLFSVSYVLTANKIMITFLQCVEAILVPIVLVKSGLSSDNALEIYGILTGMALPVIMFPSALNTSISTMVLPTVASANTSGKNRQLKRTTTVSIWFSIVIGIFFIGFFLQFGDFIGSVIFGHKKVGEYIMILAWLCPFMYLSITLGSILHGLGKTNTAFIHNVLGTFIRLCLLWFGVPQVGIVGYLWGLLLSEVMVTFLHSLYIKKEIHFKFNPFTNIIKPAIWMFISMAGCKLVQFIFSFSSFSGILFLYVSYAFSGITLLGIFSYFVFNNYKDINNYC